MSDDKRRPLASGPTIRELLDLIASGIGMTLASPDGSPATLLASRVEEVLKMHTRQQPLIEPAPPYCSCLHDWPCPTIRALNGEQP